jgi:hypothetical protein
MQIAQTFRVMNMFDTKRLLAIAGIILVASVADIAIKNWHHCAGKDQAGACYKRWPTSHIPSAHIPS